MDLMDLEPLVLKLEWEGERLVGEMEGKRFLLGGYLRIGLVIVSVFCDEHVAALRRTANLSLV